MSITLTPRFITVLSRYFEVHREEIIKKGLKFPGADESIDTFCFGKDNNIRVNFDSNRNYHHYLCSEYDGCSTPITAEEEKCEMCEEIHGITFTVSINLKTCTAVSITFTKDTTLEEMLEKIEKYSGKVYDLCSCDTGRLAFKDGLCSYCYIHYYTRTEEEGGDCSICYENGGRWCEFEDCKHQFHIGCVSKMDKIICPLCRGKGAIKKDPFDI